MDMEKRQAQIEKFVDEIEEELEGLSFDTGMDEEDIWIVACDKYESMMDDIADKKMEQQRDERMKQDRDH